MEKFKVLFIFLLSFCVSKIMAQQYTPMTAAGYAMKRVKVDSTLHLPSFCGTPTLRNSTAINGALAMDTCNNKLYKWTHQNGWSIVGQIIDTTIYVKYSDTSAMLAPYAQTIYVDAQLATKLNISDTANKWITNVYRKTATDSVFYVKGGNSTFAFTDSTGGGQNGRFGNDTATIVMAKVHNDAGSTLTNGEVVYLGTSGTNSDAPSVRRAKNTADSTSANTFGFVTGTINTHDTGWVILSGKIEKLNTAAFNNGDIIYLDSIAGKWTKSKPKAPYHLVYLGVVVKSNAGNGSIFVKPQNGYELDEIHDVQINGVTNNQILVYSDTQKVWKNRSVYSVVDTTSLSNRINLKLNISDTSNKWITNVYRKTASDSVFYVKGGTNTFAFKDSTGGGGNIYTTDGSLTNARTLTLNNFPLSITGASAANTSRFHANGNVTIGTAAVALNDSTYKLNVISTGGNVVRFVMRSGISGGQAITFTQSDVYNTINSASHLFLSTGNSLTIGAGSGSRIALGATSADVLTPVAIGYKSWESSSASAILDIKSTTRGFLQPRMTNTQMNAIASPTTGLSIFNTTDSSNYLYRGTGGGWQRIPSYFTTGNLGIGTSTDAGYKLDVNGTAILRGVSRIQTIGSNNYFDLNSNTTGGVLNFDAFQSGVYDYRTEYGGNTAGTFTTSAGIKFGNTTGAFVNIGANSGYFQGNNTILGGQTYLVSTNDQTIRFSHRGTADRGIIGFAASTNYLQIRTGGATTLSNGTLSTIFDNTGSVGIGGITSVNSSAQLEMSSTTKGFLPPRMTTTQRTSITSPAEGLMVYDLTLHKLYVWDGTAWQAAW